MVDVYKSENEKIIKAMNDVGIETDGQRLEREKRERKLKHLKKETAHLAYKEGRRVIRKKKRLSKNRATRRKLVQTSSVI